MQAAIDGPELVAGVVLMDVSLRMLHETKQVCTSLYKQPQ